MTHAHSLDRGLLIDKDAACLVQGKQQWTYADVARHSYRLARKLKEAGYEPGTKASILSRNSAAAFMCVFGIARAGLTWVPANPKLNEEDNAYLLNFMDCELLIFHSDLADMVRSLQRQLPKLTLWLCLDRQLPDFLSLEDWLGDVSAEPIDAFHDPDAVAIIAPTGGTTGRSKGVQLTQRNVNVFMASHLMSLHYPHSERPVNLAAAPLTHAAGFAALPTVARGGKVVFARHHRGAPSHGAVFTSDRDLPAACHARCGDTRLFQHAVLHLRGSAHGRGKAQAGHPGFWSLHDPGIRSG